MNDADCQTFATETAPAPVGTVSGRPTFGGAVIGARAVLGAVLGVAIAIGAAVFGDGSSAAMEHFQGKSGVRCRCRCQSPSESWLCVGVAVLFSSESGWESVRARVIGAAAVRGGTDAPVLDLFGGDKDCAAQRDCDPQSRRAADRRCSNRRRRGGRAALSLY